MSIDYSTRFARVMIRIGQYVSATWAGWLTFFMIITTLMAVIGYILNIAKLLSLVSVGVGHTGINAIEAVIRFIGIFLAPVGAILGFF